MKKHTQKNSETQYGAHKGFTLIELLVVVAIIALLAATILASLGSARTRARAARIQSEVSSMRAAAELYYNESGSYDPHGTGDMFSNTTSGMNNLVMDASGAAAAGATTNPCPGGNTITTCKVDPGSWAFLVTLPTSDKFCSDSNGYSGKAASVGAVGTANYQCIQ